MDFIQLAQQAKKELDGEYNRVAQKEAKLEVKASLLASQEADLLKLQESLNLKDRALKDREELVTTKELSVRRDSQVQSDLRIAESHHEAATQELKKAQEYRDEVKVDLEDLSKRELALSEREKTYREEIKKQIASKMLGI